MSEQIYEGCPSAEPERLRIFDPLANVRMIRYDLDNFGRVRAETWDRVALEQLTFLVESYGGQTPITYKRQEGQLLYFSVEDGWGPYREMLDKGSRAARQEAGRDPRKHFLVGMTDRDLENAEIMNCLRVGQQAFWYSPFPYEAQAQSGDDFLADLGFQPQRRMGFLYRAYCRQEDEVVLESQPVDRSDEDAFRAAMAEVNSDIESGVNIEDLLHAYDAVLQMKDELATGVVHEERMFYAGRLLEEERRDKVWELVSSQHTLVQVLLLGLRGIAEQNLTEVAATNRLNNLLAGVWQQFKDRLDGEEALEEPTQPGYMFVAGMVTDPTAYSATLYRVEQSRQKFIAAGTVITACGGSIRLGKDGQNIMDGSAQGIADEIFGKQREGNEEKYKFNKFMHCVECQSPPPPSAPKKMCGPCGLCRSCDRKARANSAK